MLFIWKEVSSLSQIPTLLALYEYTTFLHVVKISVSRIFSDVCALYTTTEQKHKTWLMTFLNNVRISVSKLQNRNKCIFTKIPINKLADLTSCSFSYSLCSRESHDTSLLLLRHSYKQKIIDVFASLRPHM